MQYIIFLVASLLCNSAFAEEATTASPDPAITELNTRLEKVERAINNNALLDMFELLQSLRTTVNTLRGDIEVQLRSIEQLKQKQRDLYIDIDKRLQRLNQNNTSTAISANTSPSAPTLPAAGSEAPATPEPDSNLTAIDPQDQKAFDQTKIEEAYQKAFQLLKSSRYEQALLAFETFLKDNPENSFSDNAQYWLGETHYVMQKYDLAINAYQSLIGAYPDSKKISHALLKIGYSYAELGNIQDAKKTLQQVQQQYPGTTVSKLADERLRKIASEQAETPRT